MQKDGWQPAGIDVLDGLMFVADAKSGEITAYDMRAGFRQVWSYGTGTTGLQGVALQQAERLPSDVAGGHAASGRASYRDSDGSALLFYTGEGPVVGLGEGLVVGLVHGLGEGSRVRYWYGGCAAVLRLQLSMRG